MISVVHIGLPLVPPWLTAEEGETISVRLAGIRQRMEQAGYHYIVLHASPDGGLTEFRERLRSERIDAIVIGGGVAGNPKLAGFKKQIIDAAQDEAPKARVLDFDHALDVPDLIRRAFEPL